jgi:hypothetical protein
MCRSEIVISDRDGVRERQGGNDVGTAIAVGGRERGKVRATGAAGGRGGSTGRTGKPGEGEGGPGQRRGRRAGSMGPAQTEANS